MIIQIVGPYRGHSTNALYNNILLARSIAEVLWIKGHYVLTPHLNTAFMGGLVPEERFLNFYLMMIEKVDAVYVFGDWEKSEGSKAEVLYARDLKKIVYFKLEDVPIVGF